MNEKSDEKSTEKLGKSADADAPEELTGQKCPMCAQDTLVLNEAERDVPYFGRVYLFSMNCSSCNYHKADIESAEEKTPCKYSFEISSEADLSVRVVKSSSATIKIPRIMTIESGPASNGYVTNIEGILNRVKVMLEKARDDAEEDEDRRKAKTMLKKIQDVLWGRDKLTITLEDPSGNSAIISDKAIKGKM